MWRYLAGAAAALLMVAAGWVLIAGRTGRVDAALPAAPAPATNAGGQTDALPDSVPEASEKTREQKRFDRYDKDRDGTVTREEYLAQRRKAFAKLDTNHDGQLSFDEWGAKVINKFAAADHDKSGGMNAVEFATTKVQRKAKRAAPCAKPREMAPADGDAEG